MPGGDGTGPAGMGPMTGRAAGYCAGYGVPGYMNFGGGRGFQGWGRRGGGRRGPWGAMNGAAWGVAPAPMGMYDAPYAPAMNAEQQLDVLKGQAEYFANALDGIRKRIDELESKSK